jgi:predicted TIM-barrel fold metal-dependent hydrolase
LALREWHAAAPDEPVLEPELPIVDPHHHLFGSPADVQFYCAEDLQQDIGAGHNVIGTVWVEAYGIGWLTSGPEELRSVGEVEQIVRASATSIQSTYGPCEVAAGIVSNVNLTLGDRVAKILEAHVAAAEGRLRGVRHHATYDDGTIARFMTPAPPHLLADGTFRRGLACLRPLGLSFEALVFHTQLDEVRHLADAFPDLPIVLNHVGQALGVGEHASRRAEVFVSWSSAMRTLALRPNVQVKVGGMGMPLFGFGFEAERTPATSRALAQAWQPYVDLAIDAFGSERCMFESNFPVDKQSCGYTQLWNAFKLTSHAFSQDERRDLFYRTACRVYRLPELKANGDRAWALQSSNEHWA